MKQFIFHKKYGKGIVEDWSNGKIIADFSGKSIKLSEAFIDFSIFLNEKDYEFSFVLNDLVKKLKGINRFTAEIAPYEADMARYLYVLYNKPVNIGLKKYRKIIGLDFGSGTCVKIIDTNGKAEELHTSNDKINSIKEYDIIKATFKQEKASYDKNVFRITSDFEVIKNIHIGNMIKIFQMNSSTLNSPFDEIISRGQKLNERQFYTLADFNGSMVGEHMSMSGRVKLQLKMGDRFVDIDPKCIEKIKAGLLFKGMALLSVLRMPDFSYSFKAIKLMGRFEKPKKEEPVRVRARGNDYEGYYDYEEYYDAYREIDTDVDDGYWLEASSIDDFDEKSSMDAGFYK